MSRQLQRLLPAAARRRHAVAWRLSSSTATTERDDAAKPSARTSRHRFRTIWKTAVQYHQFAAVSLLASCAIPSARARAVGGAAILAGGLAFSGSNYLVAYHQDRAWGKLAPYGGTGLIGGFLAFAAL